MSTEQAETTMPATLAAALAQFQAKLPTLVKSETARVKMKDGGTYEYSYADLAQVNGVVLPLLGALGLSFTCRPTYNEAGKFVLAYKLLHVSKECEVGEYPLSQSGTPQQIGGEITYAKRYVLCALVGVASADDDDDAVVASNRPAGKARPEWDAAEQAVLYDGWLAEIESSKDVETLAGVGRRINAASNNGELSPVTHAKLRAEGARRNVELSQDETAAVGEVAG